MTMFKKIILFCSVLMCSSIHAAESKTLAINRKQVEQFFDANKISYSVVRDTYSKLKYLKQEAPYALIALVKKVNNNQCVFSINAVEWWRYVGLIDEQKVHVRSSIIHTDVIKVIQKLAF